MFPERSQELFPIACRVVSTDQWLVTRFDASWKVSEVKQYILSKVGGSRDATHFRYPPRHRPVSPITFASVHPSRNSLDTAEDSYYDYFEDYDFESDTEIFSFDGSKDTKPKQPPTPQESQLPSPFTAYSVQQYPLVTFSTGLLLEDDYSLSWYQLRPHELLELHPPGLVVRLPREIMLEYIQPYFEAKVKALRIVWSDKDFRLDKLDKDRDYDSKSRAGKAKADSSKPWRGVEASVSPGLDKSALPVIRRRRKTKLEWKERWVVVNQGMFNLFKDRTDPNPVHSSPLSSLCALRGAEDLFRGTSGPSPSPHVICTKFRTNSIPSAGGEPQQDMSTSPISEGWVDPWSGATIPKDAEDNVAPSSITSSGLWTRRGSKEDGGRFRKSSNGNVAKEGKKGKDKEGAEDKSRREASGDSVKPDSGKKDQEGIWLILDMQDESYHDSLLRILHRSSSESTTSTFVPSPTVDEVQKPPTPPASPAIRALTRKPHALPYPDWRVDVARKAQKAGMGDVGLAMGYIMWGESAIHHKPRSSRKSQSTITEAPPEDKPPLAQTSMFGTDDDSDESFDSEMEWERWEDEVKRHGRSRAKGKAKGKTKANQPLSPMSPTQTDVPGEIETVRRRLARMDPPSSLSSPSSAESLHPGARDPEQAQSPLAQPTGLPSSSSSPSTTSTPRPAAERERKSSYAPLLPDPGAIELDAHALSAGPALMTQAHAHRTALPVPLSGIMTSTVSAGGVVRARSLRAYNEDGRGRGVPQAMAVLNEHEPVPPEERRPAKLQKPRGDGERERRRLPSAASVPAWRVPPASPTDSTPSASTGGAGAGVSVGVERSTSQRWRPTSAHGGAGASASAKVGRPRTGSTAPPPESQSQTQGRAQGRPVSQDGLRGLAKAVKRTKAFSPDRLVKGLDSALDFVEGK